MATIKQIKDDVKGKVNGVMTALDLYPDIKITDTGLSVNMSANPIDLLMDLFKSIKGYDWLINTISKFIAYELPPLELAVKAVILNNIQTMLSCSIKPIITESMIRDGIVFDLNKIDLFNIFAYSPLDRNSDNPGRYYYFGCNPEDGIDMIDDLKFSRDFNAVLWYAKNSPGERVVWRRERDVGKPYNVMKVGTHEPFTWMKQTKSNGIATIEFNGRSSGLSNSEHSAEYFVKEPIDNCLHVFIGYCAPEITGGNEEMIAQCTKKISEFEKWIEKIDKYKESIDVSRRIKRTEAIDNGADGDVLNKIDVDAEKDLAILKSIEYAINGIDINTSTQYTGDDVITILGTLHFELNTTHETIDIPTDLGSTNIIIEKTNKLNYIKSSTTQLTSYPSATSNYYYLHPLFEWNTDFVMSMKLFDEKVITAQLLDAITNCLKFTCDGSAYGNININFQMQFVEAQLRDVVTKILESDDGVVSDSLFPFTNDSYNALLNEVELNRAGLSAINENTVNVSPDAKTILSSLNTLNTNATKEEMESVVSSSLFTAVSNTTPLDFGHVKGTFSIDTLFGFTGNMSIIDQLLTKLAYTIVAIVMQPKVYILLMTNLTILGNEPNFDLTKFLQQFNNLITELIKEIRDKILDYFKNSLLLLLQEIVSKLTVKFTLEQYQYYITLLTHCLDCLKIHRNEYDWLQDDVNYADILESIEQPNEEY